MKLTSALLLVAFAAAAFAAAARADTSTRAPPTRAPEMHALAGPFARPEDFCGADQPNCVHGIFWNFGTFKGHDFIEGIELALRGRHPLGLRTRRGWYFDEHALDELGAPDGTNTEEAAHRMLLYASRIEERRVDGGGIHIVTTAESVLVCAADADGTARCTRPITAFRRAGDPDEVDPLGPAHLTRDGKLQLGARR